MVDDGTCSVEKEPTASPNLSLTMGPVEFLKMLSGAGSPAMMFMMGKIKATGDLGLAAGLANWFESPAGLTGIRLGRASGRRRSAPVRSPGTPGDARPASDLTLTRRQASRW